MPIDILLEIIKLIIIIAAIWGTGHLFADAMSCIEQYFETRCKYKIALIEVLARLERQIDQDEIAIETVMEALKWEKKN